MATMVFFDELATPQAVVRVRTLADPAPFRSATNMVLNPDLSLLASVDVSGDVTYLVPREHWKHDAGAIVEFTQAEKDALAAAEAAADAAAQAAYLIQVRTEAAAGMDNFEVTPLLLRAFADILKDEINILRDLHSLAPRTLAQLKTQITARVNSGTVDT